MVYADELKLNGIAIIALFGCYIPLTLLFEQGTNIRALLTNLCVSSVYYVFSFASTWWVIKQYQKKLKKQNNHDHNQDDPSSIQFMTLEQVLNTEDGFEVFANHLVNEFSTENLFFVLEMMQIKNQVAENKFGVV